MKKRFKGVLTWGLCIVQTLIILGGSAGCAARTDGAARQEQPASNETRQEQLPASQVQSETQAQNTEKTAPNAGGQISLDDAKTAALTDAGVMASDVRYTKEKLDYEDGIAVYEL